MFYSLLLLSIHSEQQPHKLISTHQHSMLPPCNGGLADTSAGHRYALLKPSANSATTYSEMDVSLDALCRDTRGRGTYGTEDGPRNSYKIY